MECSKFPLVFYLFKWKIFWNVLWIFSTHIKKSTQHYNGIFLLIFLEENAISRIRRPGNTVRVSYICGILMLFIRTEFNRTIRCHWVFAKLSYSNITETIALFFVHFLNGYFILMTRKMYKIKTCWYHRFLKHSDKYQLKKKEKIWTIFL